MDPKPAFAAPTLLDRIVTVLLVIGAIAVSLVIAAATIVNGNGRR